MEWLNLVASIFAGVAGGALYKYYINRSHPYRWVCPEKGCKFLAKTNHAQVLEAIQTAHIHDHGLRKGMEE